MEENNKIFEVGLMLDKNHYIKKDIVNLVGEFTIHWNLLEYYYFGCDASDKLVISFNYEDYVQDLIRPIENFRLQLKAFSSYWGSEITLQSVLDMLYTKKSSLDKHGEIKDDVIERIQNNVIPFLQDNKMSANKKVQTGMFCIHRIRNNLFHGEKKLQTVYFQKKLLDSACDVLSVLTQLEKCLERLE